MEKNAQFCHILADLIDKKGVTLEDIAKDLGVAYTTLHHWKSGKVIPKIDQLPGLCRFFGVSAGQLLGLEPIEKADVKTESGIIDQMRDLLIQKTGNIPERFIELSRDLPRAASDDWDQLTRDLLLLVSLRKQTQQTASASDSVVARKP